MGDLLTFCCHVVKVLGPVVVWLVLTGVYGSLLISSILLVVGSLWWWVSHNHEGWLFILSCQGDQQHQCHLCLLHCADCLQQ